MTKAYRELLGEWVKQRESTKRDKNLVAFLAVRDNVEEALEAGYSVTTIWTNMHGEKRVAFGYQTFLRYVNRYLRAGKKESVDELSSRPERPTFSTPARTGATIAPTEAVPQVKAADKVLGFTFNAAPKKEDLI